MSSDPERKAVICDANVLIDFTTVDLDILAKAASFYSKVYVPDCIIHEVNNLSSEKAEKLGIIIIPTPYREVVKLPNLSFEDAVCLFYVKKENYVCITNDKVLRRECIAAGGEVVWGMEMLLNMVQKKIISTKKATSVAKKISEINPTITKTVLDDFLHKLEQ
ncbi:MAG: hypothetical protein JW881_04490 [Spirochaetales bacterium]|nr:hypothetical protein [Spirochaetales bacterium]